MVDLLLGGAAAVLLIAAMVVLLKGERRPAISVALIVLAIGTFAGAIFHYQSTPAAVLPDLPIASAAVSPAASQGLGTATLHVEVPMGTGDKYPQGAIWLDPPRAGTDAYTGDLSLLCSTPGKTDHDQNCTGADKRVWTAEPLAKRALISPATGDPFADPAACAESNGAAYQAGYLELAAGKGYCVRLTGDTGRTFALRIPSFPVELPLPAALKADIAVLG
ncbi:hypothetical protein [Paractinoplanes durhamensis]|uniref:Uncharacterized protein n=1 Tax=Paractinoplanes durhamensis TaxID=113563 RepID=A0ABQ3Z7Q7_9ACTN|nr:hypothetical protein [Actinoplanes durhamensis]GIE05796.1 hypothetical protein Adu01nite_71460 [Actinoplanes durhamensis]